MSTLATRTGSHYDPNQPRVPAGDPSHHGGQWTKDGVTAASAAVEADPRFVQRLGGLLPRALAEALARIVAMASLPLVALGALLLPRTGNRFAEGVVPGHPDIGYRYDNGVLTLTLGRDAGDQLPLLFQGRADADGFYRLADGTAIAHDLGTGVVLNERAIGAARHRQATRARAGTAARSKDDVKLCPDPGPDRPSNDHIDWRLYQAQISGLPLGKAVVLNGVHFDGCRTTNGTMLEAKGRGYARFLKNGEWPEWFKGKYKLSEQMMKQSMAAGDRVVEWHFAEAAAAEAGRRLAASLGLKNIVVIHTPQLPWEGVSP